MVGCAQTHKSRHITIWSRNNQPDSHLTFHTHGVIPAPAGIHAVPYPRIPCWMALAGMTSRPDEVPAATFFATWLTLPTKQR